MKAIVKISLFLMIFLVSKDASAIFGPRQAPTPKTTIIKKPRKLKLKKKVALWMLKRRIKKQLRQNNVVFIPLSDSSGCDRIFLKTGDIMEVKIVKVSATDVQFVRCGADAESEMAISKADIEKIYLSDGAMVYQNTDAQMKKDIKKKKKKRVLGTILLVLLVLVLAPVITIGILAAELSR